MIEWWTFVLIMALGQFSPGPDMVLLTRSSLLHGRAAGWAVAGGVATGLMIHSALAVAGLATVFHSSIHLRAVLSFLAAGYLLWLGWQMLASARKGTDFSMTGEKVAGSQLTLIQCWRRGFLCNILNPKVAIFLASVVTPFLSGAHEQSWPWLLWVTVWLEGFLLWGIWATVLQLRGVRGLYMKMASWIDVCFGIALWGMAGLLLYSLL